MAETPGRERTFASCRWRLAAVLVAAIALRGAVAMRGGQFYNGDEDMHFMPGLAAAGTLIDGHWIDHLSQALSELGSQYHHIGFRLWSFLAALVSFGLVGPAAYEQAPIMAWVLSMSSVASIALVYLIARRSGAEREEATLAALLAAGSTALIMYAGHLHPYDTGLAVDLFALWLGLWAGGVGRAFLVGFVAATGFLSYYGYLAVAGIALMLHLTRGSHRVVRTVAAGLGWVTPFVIAETLSALATRAYFPDREPYHEALWRLLNGAPESWGSSYAEGWWVPFAYLWHAEHVVVLAWVALAVAGWRSPRVRLWGGCALALYAWLTLSSTVMHQAVVLGRFVRQMVPFLCLAAAAGYTTLRPRVMVRTVGWVAWVAVVAMNLTPLLTQRFPGEMRLAWEARVGLLAYETDIVGPVGLPGEPTSNYVALNVEPSLMTWPVLGRRPAGSWGTLLESYPHPLDWPAAQYEGYTPEARAALRVRPYRMELWRRE